MLGARYKDLSSYTLTRLHARYGKNVTNDLVFRAVEPIAGGRGVPDAQGEISTKVTKESYNNFQGRYVIEHPWTGPVSCATPQRGVWGGPLEQQQIATQAATNLAFAPRGQVQLSSLLAKDIPSVGLMSSNGQTPPIAVRQGCGCETTDRPDAVLGFAAVGLVAMLRRRRRG